jgi:hypothetical protein
VADYDVEIAEKTAIGNPTVASVLAGTSFEVEATTVAGGEALACEVEIDHSRWLGSRQVETRHGAIECPHLGLLRARGSLVVPVGGSRVAGVWVEDDRAWVALLNVNADE